MERDRRGYILRMSRRSVTAVYVLVRDRGHEINEPHEEENEDHADDVELEERVRLTQKRNLPVPLVERQ